MRCANSGMSEWSNSQNLFPLLGLKPILGRNFLPEEEQLAKNRVIILSQPLWRRGFAGDAGIIGKSIRLDGGNFTVVGVMGEQYPLETDFWLPLSHLRPVDLTDRRNHSVQTIGRLKDGVTFEQARKEMDLIAERLRQSYPESNKNIGVELTPMRNHLVGNLRLTTLLVFAAAALILLIACANVSNLLLAQSAGRQRELAIRAAIGAGRGRLIRQLLVESLLLSALGGLTGLSLAFLSVPVLKSGLLGTVTEKIPGLELVGIDWRTLAFSIGVSLLTAVLFGALPALLITRIDLNQMLKEGGKRPAGVGQRNLSRVLVMTEVALAVVTLIGAGLLLKSFQNLSQVDPGFRPDHLLSMKIEVSPSRYQAYEQGRPFDERDFGKAWISNSDDTEVIINETMARRFFPNQDPVGKRIFMHFGAGNPTPVLIQGVVADIKDLGLDAAVEPEIYWNGVEREAVLLVRTDVDPSSLAPAIRQAMLSIDPALPMSQASSIEDILAATLARRRFTVNLLSVAALVALLLAAIGIYGVVAYSVAQRMQEIGIRLAMGAQAGDVLRLIMGRGITPVLLGLAIGLASAVGLSRSITHLTTGLLFEVRATDPLTFTAMAVLLLLIALLACYLPARRATKVDPLIALRHE